MAEDQERQPLLDSERQQEGDDNGQLKKNVVRFDEEGDPHNPYE